MVSAMRATLSVNFSIGLLLLSRFFYRKAMILENTVSFSKALVSRQSKHSNSSIVPAKTSILEVSTVRFRLLWGAWFTDPGTGQHSAINGYFFTRLYYQTSPNSERCSFDTIKVFS